jgi:hypothetical protein
MCKTISAFFKPDTMEVRVNDLSSHSNTMEKLHLEDGPAANGWREMHYLPDGEVECRTLSGDSRNGPAAVECIRKRWPTFLDFLTWATAQEGVCGSLYLSGLTALPANAKLSAGGSLDLSGLTALPANAKLSAGGSLYLSGLTALPANAKLSAGGSLYLSGLTALPKMDTEPKASAIYLKK